MRSTFLKRRAAVVLLLALGIVHRSASAQPVLEAVRGLGLEVGTGHNQLLWSTTTQTGDRKQLFITPNLRVHYSLPLASRVSLLPFIGYNEFGGRSKKQPMPYLDVEANYKDRIRFRSMEAGLFPLYGIRRDLRLGIGMKLNRHLQMTQRAHFDRPSQHWDEPGWQDADDMSFFFDRWSFDTGVRGEWNATRHAILGLEGWLGLSKLESRHVIEGTKIRQRHIRVLLAYRL